MDKMTVWLMSINAENYYDKIKKKTDERKWTK